MHDKLCPYRAATMESAPKQNKESVMQHIFNEVAERLMSSNPDADSLLTLLQELHTVEMDISARQQKMALRNVAAAFQLEIPECLN